MKVDLVVLTETKKKGSGNETSGNNYHIFNGVDKHERAKRGVWVLINKKWWSVIKNRDSIDDRFLKLDMDT